MARLSAVACALVAALLLAAEPARAAFVVETGTLIVERPPGFGPYDISVANFGRTLYGGQLRCALRRNRA